MAVAVASIIVATFYAGLQVVNESEPVSASMPSPQTKSVNAVNMDSGGHQDLLKTPPQDLLGKILQGEASVGDFPAPKILTTLTPTTRFMFEGLVLVLVVLFIICWRGGTVRRGE